MAIKYPDQDSGYEEDEDSIIENAAKAIKGLVGSNDKPEEGKPVEKPSRPDDKKLEKPVYLKALDLLDASGNATRGVVAEGINTLNKNFGGEVEIKPIDGRYSAEAFRKGFGIGYLADQKKSFRDDINNFTSDPLGSSASLGARALDTVGDIVFEGASDPLTYVGVGLANRFAKGAKALGASENVADVAGRASVGAGYGALGNVSNETSDQSLLGLAKDTAFGAVTFGAAKPIAKGFVQGAEAAGGVVLRTSLGEKSIEFAGKAIKLAESIKNPTIQKAAINAQRKIGNIAHEIRQGRLKSLDGLSDEDAVTVNKAFKAAKTIENQVAHEAYEAEARKIFGDDLVDEQLKKSKASLADKDTAESLRDIDISRHATDALLDRFGGDQVKNYLWNKARYTARQEMKDGNAVHDAVFASLKKESADAARKWADHNDAIVAKYNAARNVDEVFNPNIEFRFNKPVSSDTQKIGHWSSYEERPVINEIKETIPGTPSSDEYNLFPVDRPVTTKSKYDIPGVAPSTETILFKDVDDSIGVSKRKIPGTPDKVGERYNYEVETGMGVSKTRTPGTPPKTVTRLDTIIESSGPSFSESESFNPNWRQGFEQLAPGSRLLVKGGNLESLQSSPMVGFKYHTEDVFDKQAFELSKKMFASGSAKGFARGVRAGEGDAAEKLIAEGVPAREAYDKAYGVYSEEAAAAFLDNAEKEAIAITSAVNREFSGGVVGVADKLTKLFKRNVLYNSISWLKQQYFDNVGKRFIEHGITWDKGLAKNIDDDINKALKGNASNITSDEANEYLKYGVTDSDYVADAMDMTEFEKTLRYRTMPKEQAKEGLLDKAIRQQDAGFGIKPLKWWSDNTQEIGRKLEWNARAKTYERLKSELIKQHKSAGLELTDAALDGIKAKAGQSTRDIFFDYRDVSAVEQLLLKRLIPFYAFTSKNLTYYADALTAGGGMAARSNILEKIHGSSGQSAFEDEDARATLDGANNYAAKGDPRVLGGDSDFVAMLVNPKSAKMDALNILSYPADLLKSLSADTYAGAKDVLYETLFSQDNPVIRGANPTVKGIAEIIAGKDMFSNQDLNLSKSIKKKNWVGQKGYFPANVNRVLESIGVDKDTAAGFTGVNISDKTGNPETKNSSTMYENKLRDIFPILPVVGPAPARAAATLYNVANAPIFNTLNQIAYNATQDKESKKTLADTLIKIFTPLDVVRKEKK